MKRVVRATGVAIVVGLLACGLTALTRPAPAQGKQPTLSQRVSALESGMSKLQKQVDTLKAAVRARDAKIADLSTAVDKLKADPVLALGRYVTVTSGAMAGVRGPNIVFSGANLHIVSGSGRTDDGSFDRSSSAFDPSKLTGLGNLIIGYDEQPAQAVARTGSHNLVLGTRNGFSAFGGLVGGDENAVSAGWATVLTGFSNTASGVRSSVVAGDGGSAQGEGSCVLAGSLNSASGSASSVTGGAQNVASGGGASVTGGYQNGAQSNYCSVSGGHKNLATAYCDSVTGGFENIAAGGESCVTGGFDNRVTNSNACISGGFYLTLNDVYGWAAGIPGDTAGSGTPAFTQAWFRATPAAP